MVYLATKRALRHVFVLIMLIIGFLCVFLLLMTSVEILLTQETTVV
ncbi:Hypothetical protein PAU_00230 [Photorhabdus asymbiotica]|uniref:Uncharacterized protein n=1 Tax=Photorhabdus asymbiotica subsp. asymbiotica (strain ATCC 43949 / 3105-77) TaxID=553480 RepID=C7BHF5_PHOAA|nr:Hypothetical protein PAU_00230 [Photorhabdus asymbiotica]